MGILQLLEYSDLIINPIDDFVLLKMKHPADRDGSAGCYGDWD
jgi:hypothetical protein